MPVAIKHLEFHISHRCNLRCKYCSHYCDFGYSGAIDTTSMIDNIGSWAKRVAPRQVHILGGEPLLNKDLLLYLDATRGHFPDATLYLVSNGLLLPRWAEALPASLLKNDIILAISEHPYPQSMQGQHDAMVALLSVWKQKIGVIIDHREAQQKWSKCYQGEGTTIIPYNSDPSQSYTSCLSKKCVTLLHNYLWKCPNIAYLQFILDKLTHRSQWERFAAYAPLGLDSSDTELERFFDTGAEPCCAMCPEVLEVVPHVYGDDQKSL